MAKFKIAQNPTFKADVEILYFSWFGYPILALIPHQVSS